MKNYYILNGQEESGPYSINMIRSRGLSRGTLVRPQDSDKWTSVEKIEELAGFILPLNILHTGTETIKEGNRSKKIMLAVRLYELVFPVLIVFALGSITVSMDKFIVRKGTHTANNSLPSAKGPVTSLIKDQIQREVNIEKKNDNITHDSIAILPLATSKTSIEHVVTPKPHPYRDGSEAKAIYYRTNWSKYMTLTNSNYKHRLLGGIKGLAISFTNKTDYPIEEVIAEITYIKANGKPWKTKMISFYNIAPHSDKQQEIAKVNRSKSVSLSIRKITSSGMHFSYDRDQARVNNGQEYNSRH